MLKIKVEGGSVIRELEIMAKNVLPADILEPIGKALVLTTQDRFESQSDPDGKPWQKLGAWTLFSRKKKNAPILTQSTDLKNSVTFQISGNILKIGPNTVYAAAQQFGSTHEIRAKPGKALAIPNMYGGNRPLLRKKVTVHIPARPYIGFGKKDEEAVKSVLAEKLNLS